jgi:hypothetical protein
MQDMLKNAYAIMGTLKKMKREIKDKIEEWKQQADEKVPRMASTVIISKRVATRYTNRVAGADDIQGSIDKTADRKPGYLTPQEKRLVNRVLHAEGLGGAKKFEKPVLGVIKALDVLKDYNLQVTGMVSSHHFNTTFAEYDEPGVIHKDYWSEHLEITNPNDDSTIPVQNSMLVISFYKQQPHLYEVTAYLS